MSSGGIPWPVYTNEKHHRVAAAIVWLLRAPSCYGPAVRHRIAGIPNHIEDGQIKIGRVDVHIPKTLLEGMGQLHTIREGRAQHLLKLRDAFAQIDNLRIGGLFA